MTNYVRFELFHSRMCCFETILRSVTLRSKCETSIKMKFYVFGSDRCSIPQGSILSFPAGEEFDDFRLGTSTIFEQL